MLDAIRDFFSKSLAPRQDDTGTDDHRLRLATAALMLEMSRVDGEVTAAEEEAMRKALEARFGLSRSEVDGLLALAEAEARDSAGDYAFTSLINKGFSAEEKVRVIENMWQIAYADGHVDAHENHFMRKLADLLYISRADYAEAKRRARDS
ncbi:MAG: TerB family tellurite resistance protein [Rhodocyclaceae bacterium]|nr:TerB family tellurite resistance protein [Rhodocyclaceae bacterium]